MLTVYGLKQAVVGPRLNEDYGDTVPSRPHNVGLVANEVLATSASRNQQILDDIEEGMSILLASCILYLIIQIRCKMMDSVFGKSIFNIMLFDKLTLRLKETLKHSITLSIYQP